MPHPTTAVSTAHEKRYTDLDLLERFVNSDFNVTYKVDSRTPAPECWSFGEYLYRVVETMPPPKLYDQLANAWASEGRYREVALFEAFLEGENYA